MEGGEKNVNASHLTLEVGLQAKPNYILLGEECSQKKMQLKDVVSDIADMVQRRWEGPGKKNFGVSSAFFSCIFLCWVDMLVDTSHFLFFRQW